MKKYASAQSYIPKVKLVEGFGKGLMEDIKRKAPFLASDITDGFSIKVRKRHWRSLLQDLSRPRVPASFEPRVFEVVSARTSCK